MQEEILAWPFQHFLSASRCTVYEREKLFKVLFQWFFDGARYMHVLSEEIFQSLLL